MTQTLLFPFWRACFRVVLDGGVILVPDPATLQRGQRYDRKAGSSPCCQVVVPDECYGAGGQGLPPLLHAGDVQGL